MPPRSGEELKGELESRQDSRLVRALEMVAPGTSLREGVDNILHARTGGLIVIGDTDELAFLFSGGIKLDLDYAPAMVYELAKMDGAIVLDRECTTILRAGVQLVPDPALPTRESGTRHRTAERVARQSGFPVITVSKSMRVIAVYVAGERHVLEDSSALLTRAHQALAALERYRQRQEQATDALSALEIEDRVTLRDLAAVAQRVEMTNRVANEVAGYMIELGTDGGVLALQLDELTAGSSQERELFLRDYAPTGPSGGGASAAGAHGSAGSARLAALTADQLLDLPAVAQAVRPGSADDLDQPVSPRGYRLLSHIPRLPAPATERIVEHFDCLQKLLSASVQDLSEIPGIDAAVASRVHEGLSRLAESALVDRYS
jgi:diadenylate cyclase